MANLKSAKKRARQNVVHRSRNQARRSELKTLTKKFLEAVDANDAQSARELMVLAESSIARAKGKKVLKPNTAARKISSMAKRLSTLQKKGA
jgi:small subunit ribosomal protein S20